jgi:hypothetical protein
MHPFALRSGLSFPASHRPLVQAEGHHYGLNRAAVGQQSEHQEDQLVGLMDAVEGGALRLAEGASASLAPVAALSLAMDHDVPLARPGVGPTLFVVAELLSRVHAASLYLLTLDTSKDAPEPAFFATHPHTRLRGVLPVQYNRPGKESKSGRQFAQPVRQS